jgi:N-hydroxyarylamine O-acetyltransferase
MQAYARNIASGMIAPRLTVRHATGESERRLLKDEGEFRSALREEFGLNMSDDEVRTCTSVMERKGLKGAPHRFFA